MDGGDDNSNGGIDLFDPAILADPYPVYRQLQLAAPVYRNDALGYWILTRYADIEGILRDVDLLLVDTSEISSPPADLPIEAQHQLAEIDIFLSSWLVCLSGDEHTRVRRLVNQGFKPRLIADLARRVRQIADELIDQADAAGSMDFVADFAYPLPITVISEMLGVAAEDRPRVMAWSRRMMPFLQSGQKTPDTVAAMHAVILEMTDYLRAIFDQRRRRPTDDLIGHLVAARDGGQGLSDEQLLATCHLLIFAGHETTSNLLGSGLYSLLRHPDQLARLRREPSLIETAVEELLRFESPTQFTSRTASTELTLGGCRIPRGEKMLLGLGAANRDPRIFDHPDTLDIGRQPNPHLAFGRGLHFCLGAALARLEARIAFETLFARVEGLHLTSEEARWRPHLNLRGLEALPISFENVAPAASTS